MKKDEKQTILKTIEYARETAQSFMSTLLEGASTPEEKTDAISLGEYTAVSIIAGIAYMVHVNGKDVNGYLASVQNLLVAELDNIKRNLKTNAPTGRKRADTWN